MFYNQMRQQQNPNVQIDPLANSRGQLSYREMQMLQKMLQHPKYNFLSPERNLGLFGNTKGQISEVEMQMLRKAQQELYLRHLQQLSQQQMQNTKGQISDRDMQYFSNQMGY